MAVENVRFKNGRGEMLAAKLELPNYEKPHNYAIFSHCFTCNKNFLAVRNISHALNQAGIAVLRFDFTGLGESEGEFTDTNFSSNVEDIVYAAKFLEENYQAPSLLVGHSLGGAASVYAANEIESVKALATIAAPSNPKHVTNLLKEGLDEIEKKGSAEISIGARPFRISKQFIDDLQERNMADILKNLRKALIVLHSPQDRVVGIENAEEIYVSAHHPKSYISLDGADHMLSRRKDSTYAGKVIAGWSERYLDIPEKETIRSKHQVVVSIGNEGFESDIVAGKHKMTADEPEELGGNDFGPNPYDFISSGLGACTAMTLRMYANRKKWDLQKVIVHLDHKKDYINTDEKQEGKIDIINRSIELEGDLDAAQKARLLEIADRCPVHRTLESKTIIETKLL